MFAHKVQSITGVICPESPTLTRKRKSPTCVLDQIFTFDIETSLDEETDESFMYIWQMAAETPKHDIVYMLGRSWQHFRGIINEINSKLEDMEADIICYVHNLSYEFAFLCGVVHCSEIFATGPHKVLLFDVGRIHFRCSFQLSGQSLHKFCETWNVEHKKLSGEEFDYSAVRYPWTQLTARQEEYCVNDVIGLIEALRALLAYHNDTLLTVPLTKTGYVRRDMKEAFKKEDEKYKELRKREELAKIAHEDVSEIRKAKNKCFSYYKRMDLQPDADLYKIANEAMRGGNTHGSRFYAGKVVKNCAGHDRCSSYPDVLINCQFPIKPFKRFGIASAADLDKLHAKKVPFLVHIAMHNVKLKELRNPCPYIPYDKCQNVIIPWLDNGRILTADYLEISITDIDWHIIRDQYIADDIIVSDCWTSKYGFIPDCVRKVIFNYYKIKTEYKGVEGKEDEYRINKENANSCYGMMATNPVRPQLVFNELTGDFDFDLDNYDIAAELTKNKKRAFLPYQWGVWTTAWARYFLQLAIDACGDYFIYTDTDSVKHVINDEIDEKLAKINRSILRTSINHNAYAKDIHGKTHYLGVYEHEGNYSQFATLGAKKYIYQDCNGLHIVIAGVNKKVGAQELQRIAEQSGMDPFKLFVNKDLTFKDAGGTEAKYFYHQPYIVIREGHELEITSNVRLKQHEYKLGISGEYDALLSDDFVKFLSRKFIENNTFDSFLEV